MGEGREVVCWQTKCVRVTSLVPAIAGQMKKKCIKFKNVYTTTVRDHGNMVRAQVVLFNLNGHFSFLSFGRAPYFELPYF